MLLCPTQRLMRTRRMTTTQYELTLQSLIDGELTLAERNEFLAGIAVDDAASWRGLALAFIEEQTLRTELGEVAADRAARQTGNANTQPVAHAARIPIRQPLGGQTGNRRVVTLAMTVLLTAVGSFFWGHASGREAGVASAQLMEHDNWPGEDASVPTVTLTSLPANPAVVDPWLTEPWAAELRAQWLQAGYVVNPRPVPVSVKLPGGGTADVIISDPEVQYVGNSAFQ